MIARLLFTGFDFTERNQGLMLAAIVTLAILSGAFA